MTDRDTDARREPNNDPTRTTGGGVPAAPMDVAPELFPAPADDRDYREGDA
jgi:hypothetical protein